MNLDERARLYEEVFNEMGGGEIIATTQLAYIVESLVGQRDALSAAEDIDLDELAWGFESLGIEQARAGVDEQDLIQIFGKSFQIRAGMAAQGLIDDLPKLWLLIASGVASQNQPQLREILGEFYWPQLEPSEPVALTWERRVFVEATRAVFYLTRKAGGWRDIDQALSSLHSLAGMQQEREREALVRLEEDKSKKAAYSSLLGTYHLAEAVALLGSYLRTGQPESVVAAIERHLEHARTLLAGSEDIGLYQSIKAASLLLPLLIRSSIWFNTSRISEAARQFARRLASEEVDNPVLELWWAQRQAFEHSLLDPFKVAIGVQMPTSAGKTLLAEFSIVQALALNPNSSVAYIVPTRALVNQITKRLRADLSGSLVQNRTVAVESATPVFELDPTEDHFLHQAPDVLVTTPEKLDLLVRSGHPSVENLALVVVDEAHHISEPQRGPRLELLLATLKRERGISCRFLLLTPFLPNAEELAQWLGSGSYEAISLDWRPSLQIRATGKWVRRNKAFYDTLEIVPSVTQPSSWAGHQIQLGQTRSQYEKRSRPQISASIAAALADKNASTLILTRGPGTAESRAADVAEMVGPQALTSEQQAILNDVVSYIRGELGDSYPLVATLGRGVAFHHAGMPPEVRALVETLLERGVVRVVAGTTTLAQGVNFPLSSVVVETLTMPQGRGKKDRPLQYSEFWNIAGRAGRALKDRIGMVVWPANTAATERQFAEYLKGEAVEVASALVESVLNIEDAGTKYNLQLVRSNPALSSFLQYLSHALKVAGYESASADVEDILRSSLVFHKMRQENRDAAERLIRWSRGFLRSVRHESLLNIADSTGLSLPSVGLLSGTATPEMRDPEFWLPENIFGGDIGPLTNIVELIAEVPEMSLGFGDRPGEFNAELVAKVIHGWVNGQSLPALAAECLPWLDDKQAVRDLGRYLFREVAGLVPWGMGALQLVATGSLDASPDLTRGRYVPAMTYYGVKSEGAVAMRMAGVPRAAAEVLGANSPSFNSFNGLRQWVRDCPETLWDEAGESRGVSGASLRRVWELAGAG